MKLITRQDLANQAAHRWWLAYLSPFSNGARFCLGDPKRVHDSLVALGPEPSPDAVDKAIDNKSWTRLTCSACHDEVNRVVAIDVTGGEYTTHICEECAKELAGLFT